MKKYIDLTKTKDYSCLKVVANCVKNGDLVLFPTETVYGIGADGLNENAVKKIFEVKKRASDNPLILHISSFDMINKIAKDITDIEYRLMDAFWPGPFTIILKKKDIVPSIVTAGLDTVAVRMPSNIIASRLIDYAETPIAAPSANISGKPSGTCLEDIFEELVPKVDYVINGGKCDIGIESTVVKVENNTVKILRPGKIAKENIEQVVNSVILDKHIFSELKDGEKVLSPGMKYRHYAPKSKCLLVYSKDNKKMIEKIKELAKEFKDAIVICNSKHSTNYHDMNVIEYGESITDIASNIFTVLRQVDKLKPDIVFIEGVEKEGLGLAIMNRLIRACSHEYIEV